MTEVTLEAIEKLLDLKLDEKFDLKLAPIGQTLGQHTVALDQIVKQTKDWNAEMAVMRERMDKYEKVLKLVGDKLNLDVNSVLHP